MTATLQCQTDVVERIEGGWSATRCQGRAEAIVTYVDEVGGPELRTMMCRTHAEEADSGEGDFDSDGIVAIEWADPERD